MSMKYHLIITSNYNKRISENHKRKSVKPLENAANMQAKDIVRNIKLGDRIESLA